MWYRGFQVCVYYKTPEWIDEWFNEYINYISDKPTGVSVVRNKHDFRIKYPDGTVIMSSYIGCGVKGRKCDKAYVEPGISENIITKVICPSVTYGVIKEVDE